MPTCLSLAGPALLIDLNKKLNYSILTTAGIKSKQQRERERVKDREMEEEDKAEGGVNEA